MPKAYQSLRHARSLFMRDRAVGTDWLTYELAEYIESFKSSSDRVRHIIYVLLVVSFLIALGVWNTNPASWSQWRMKEWARRQVEGAPDITKMPPEKRKAEMKPRAILRAYPEQYVERMVVVDVPLVGIAVDVNDFGLLGGIVLTVLLAILLFAIARMHDNLYLAIFKLRKLVERDPRASDGESKANFLYHALAMGQVLYRPPTLARWRPRRTHGIASIALRFALLVPLLVHGTTVWDNWRSREIVRTYRQLSGQEAPNRFWIQVAFLALILTLTTVCWIYGRATDQRWRNIFFRINPRLRLREPGPWMQWVRIHSRWSKREKKLRKALVAALRAGLDTTGGEQAATDPTVPQMIRVRWPNNSVKVAESAALDVMRSARRSALAWCDRHGQQYRGLNGFQLDRPILQDRHLAVRLTWSFLVDPDGL